MISPVIATTHFRRPKYTRQFLDALSQCEGISEVPVVIAQDWSDKYSTECGEVSRLTHEFWHSRSKYDGFDSVSINNPALGIDLNKFFVIQKAFERGNFVIFLEDDHKICRSGLQWFIEQGRRFEHDERIGFITGYARQTKEEFEASSPNEIGFAAIADTKDPGFNPTGWATWKNRWDYFFPGGVETYRKICGEQSNGLFDHVMHLRHGEVLTKHPTSGTIGLDCPKYPGIVGPKIARIQSTGWENSEHTPSLEWHLEFERNEWGMWNLE